MTYAERTIESSMLFVCYRTGGSHDREIVTVGTYSRKKLSKGGSNGKWSFLEDLSAPGLRSSLVEEDRDRRVTHWAAMPDPDKGDGPGWVATAFRRPANNCTVIASRVIYVSNVQIYVEYGEYRPVNIKKHRQTIGRCWQADGPNGPVSHWGLLIEDWTEPSVCNEVNAWMPLPAPPGSIEVIEAPGNGMATSCRY